MTWVRMQFRGVVTRIISDPKISFQTTISAPGSYFSWPDGKYGDMKTGLNHILGFGMPFPKLLKVCTTNGSKDTAHFDLRYL